MAIWCWIKFSNHIIKDWVPKTKEVINIMQYLIPFQLRNKENNIIVEYNKIENVKDSGFEVLNVPFDVNQCIGYL